MAIKVIKYVEDSDRGSGEGFAVAVQVASGSDLVCGPDYPVVWREDSYEEKYVPTYLTRADALELGQALIDAANTYDTDDDVDVQGGELNG